MKKLIICEKPTLARTVASALHINNRINNCYENNDYIVTNAFGHLFALYDVDDYLKEKKKWKDVKLPFYPNPFVYKLREDEGVIKQYGIIEKQAKRNDVDAIIHAGDADREGEIIIRNITEHLKVEKPIYRLWLPDQTPETILEELRKLEDDSKYDSLANEGYARTYLDWLFGINLTRYVTLKKGTLMPIGRVLIPIVKFIYDRDKSIEQFVPKTYYVLAQTLTKDDQSVEIEYKKDFDTKDENFRNELNSKQIEVTKVTNSKSVKAPKKLFSLSTLQQELNRQFGYNFADSLEVIQRLYEMGYITYPRTNTEYLSENEKDKIKKIIDILKNKHNIEFKDNKRIFDSSKVESHSAITITTKIADYTKLPEKDKNVYLTVYKRFLANFSKEDCIVSKTKVTLQIGDYIHELNGESIVEKGWMKYENEKNDKIIPAFKKGDIFPCQFDFKEKKSSPPKKVTENMLSNYLKNPFRNKDTTEDEEYKAILSGIEIGTEATRTGIIENAIKYGYISKKKSSFSIEPKGIELIETLDRLKIDLYATKTVEFSQLLKRIYHEENTIDDIVNKAEEEITGIIKASNSIDLLRYGVEVEEIGKCPVCNSSVFENAGSYYCSNFQRGCRFQMRKDSPFFTKYIKTPFTKDIAKALLSSKEAIVTLMSKQNKPYQIRITYTLQNGYPQYERKFVNNTKDNSSNTNQKS